MAQNITIAGASYSAVPSIEVPLTASGTASYYDVSDTTATASDVSSGKQFYASDGTLTTGTASGGSSTVAYATRSPNSNTLSVSFDVAGEPLMWCIQWTYTSGSYMSASSTRFITSVCCDGTNCYASSVYKSGSSARIYYYTTATFSYADGVLTVTSPSSSTLGYFRSGYTYRLIYVY